MIDYVSREDKLVERAKALKVNVGTDLNADLGPVITKEVQDFLSTFCPSHSWGMAFNCLVIVV